MGNHLKTRTWPQRNIKALRRLEEVLLANQQKDILVLHINPGAAAEQFVSKLATGDEYDLDFITKKKMQWTDLRESHARDNPESRLVSFEPLEIYNVLSKSVGIREMIVAHTEKRVREAVERLGIPNLITINWNIGRGVYPGPRVDLVISWRKNSLQELSLTYPIVRDEKYLAINLLPEVPDYIEGFKQVRLPNWKYDVERDRRNIYYKVSHELGRRPGEFHAPPINEEEIRKIVTS
jgi:hypothetical protein